MCNLQTSETNGLLGPEGTRVGGAGVQVKLLVLILVDLRLSHFGPLHVDELVAVGVCRGYPESQSVVQGRVESLETDCQGRE